MLLASLYLSQGLPFGFFTQALPVLLRNQGASLTAIGLSALLTAPWALKFLWAPLVDSYGGRGASGPGRRRAWILPLQWATVGVLVLLALTDTVSHPAWLLGCVLVTNLLAATQDIATDALAVDILRPEERGLGNGVQVAGYRVGMIIGGGALLIVFHHAGWMLTFLGAAMVLALATLPIAMHRERAPDVPDAPGAPAPSHQPHPRNPLLAVADAVQRPGMARWLGVLAVYKFGESFATAMLRPLLVDLGLDMEAIGWVVGGAGFTAGLLGALAGGWAITRMDRHRRASRGSALIGFALIQAMAVALYLVPATGVADISLLYLVCAVEHFASGMATAALFTVMMDRSRPEAAATDYTVQASVIVIATGSAAAASGFSADMLGYPTHFGTATILCLAAVWMVWQQAGPARQRSLNQW
jgi:MFS family permease